jgi:diaminohydroxyphosphoribosylaminopyrimidine deaminase/5-amino-6-(5-phosphoribosylamino)uracil reductase
MARALQLAERGRYSTRPNPMVGCVIAKDDRIVGEGFHQRAGEAHAEVHALAMASKAAAGSTVYVTLEPCSHAGRTPPCADALIEHRVARVVIAIRDPSDKVNGQGIARLEAAGIEVDCCLMSQQSARLNEGFLQRITTGRPLVRLKVAMSLDGATAMQSGESQWITSAAARADVQRLRAESGAILTGIGTVLADDPSLTVRNSGFDIPGQPLRVVADSSLRMPHSARMLDLPGGTLIASRDSGVVPGADVVAVGSSDPGIDLAALLAELGRREINVLLVEGGPTLSGALLAAGLVDELVIYQAPLILGSATRRFALTPGLQKLADGRRLHVTDRRQIGTDTRIVARFDDSTNTA